MSNIIYLIGAGASFGKRNEAGDIIEGLPIVNEIPKRIGDIVKIIQDVPYTEKNSHKILPLGAWGGYGVNTIKEKVIEGLLWLQDTSAKHSSIDTFAKKLWLRGKVDDYKKLKRLLAFYFMIEQLIKKPDNRYDAFFANILDDNAQIPENVTIFSWNYDNQFEIAYKEYSDAILSSLDKHDVPSTLEYSKAKLFKINGTAYFSNIRELSTVYTGEELSEDALIQLCDLYVRAEDESSKVESKLSFAWESNEKNDSLMYKATHQLTEADTLVVIGYSFPFFNRGTDRMLITLMSNLKTVYFQDKYPTKIEERFKAITNRSGLTKIHYPETEQFFLPPEL